MKPTKKIKNGIDAIKVCSRCGNDFLKGKYSLHFPYEKRYIVLCHICWQGLLFGFYKDFRQMLKEIE